MPSQENNWSALHVQALVQEFCVKNIRVSLRYKALAVMAIINDNANGFNQSSGMSLTDLANTLEATQSNLSETVILLEKFGLIRRDRAPIHGYRKILTPLSPDHWKLASGEKFQYQKMQEENWDGTIKNEINRGWKYINEDNNTGLKKKNYSLLHGFLFSTSWKHIFMETTIFRQVLVQRC